MTIGIVARQLEVSLQTIPQHQRVYFITSLYKLGDKAVILHNQHSRMYSSLWCQYIIIAHIGRVLL